MTRLTKPGTFNAWLSLLDDVKVSPIDEYKATARCPMGHNTGSVGKLHVSRDNGKLLLHCFVCDSTFHDILAAILESLDESDLAPDHNYVLDNDGTEPTAAEHVRIPRVLPHETLRADLDSFTKTATEQWQSDHEGFLHYLAETGADLATLEELRVGYVLPQQEIPSSTWRGPRILFPFFDDQYQAIGGQVRAQHNGAYGWRSLNTPDSGNWLGCGYLPAERASDVLVITEGPRDALTSCVAGFDTVVAAGITTLRAEERELIKVWAKARPIVVAFDNDSTKARNVGQEAATELQAALQDLGLTVGILTPPANDLTAWRLTNTSTFAEVFSLSVANSVPSEQPSLTDPAILKVSALYAEAPDALYRDPMFAKLHAQALDYRVNPFSFTVAYLTFIMSQVPPDHIVRVNGRNAHPTLATFLVGNTGGGKDALEERMKDVGGLQHDEVRYYGGLVSAESLPLLYCDTKGTRLKSGAFVVDTEASQTLARMNREGSTLEAGLINWLNCGALGTITKTSSGLYVPGRTYSGGLLLAFQHDYVGDYLKRNNGASQRFLWTEALPLRRQSLVLIQATYSTAAPLLPRPAAAFSSEENTFDRGITAESTESGAPIFQTVTDYRSYEFFEGFGRDLERITNEYQLAMGSDLFNPAIKRDSQKSFLLIRLSMAIRFAKGTNIRNNTWYKITEEDYSQAHLIYETSTRIREYYATVDAQTAPTFSEAESAVLEMLTSTWTPIAKRTLSPKRRTALDSLLSKRLVEKRIDGKRVEYRINVIELNKIGGQ